MSAGEFHQSSEQMVNVDHFYDMQEPFKGNQSPFLDTLQRLELMNLPTTFIDFCELLNAETFV